MKYIIVGLGSFGSSLAEKLTQQGNEVIGIDHKMSKIELYKERISHTICMNAIDEASVSGLPLYNTDIVIISIGKDQGANILATALFKNLRVKRLISRAIDILHENILKAIGVDEIVHPEEETAERWAEKLCSNNIVNSFKLNENFSIIEVTIKKPFAGKTIREIQLRKKYNILALTTIKQTTDTIQEIASPDTILEENNILVIYGSNKDLKTFINQQ